MKYLLSIFLTSSLLLVHGQQTLKEIPIDLKPLGVTPYYEPTEILRVWRFPEGGAVFEQLVEFSRTDSIWTITKYTYIVDEYRNDNSFRNLRKKARLTGRIAIRTPTFVNDKLLFADVNNEKNKYCLCDRYLAEYRNGDQGNIFEFDLEEISNTNGSKIVLMKALEQIFEAD